MAERMHRNPPRRRMAEIAGRLGVDATTTSGGGSVLREFLEVVAEAVPTPLAAARYSSKDKLLGAIVTTLIGKQIGYALNGGTVTNDHLDDIIHALDEAELRLPDGPSNRSAIPNEFDSDLEDMADARTTALRVVARRERAPEFRRALLRAYDSRCAMTDANAVVTLEAAHIYPYRGSWTNAVQNGLLLRADMHRAFDAGEIAIETRDWSIVVSGHLAGSTLGKEVAGRTLRLPNDPAQRPSIAALDRHREIVGL